MLRTLAGAIALMCAYTAAEDLHNEILLRTGTLRPSKIDIRRTERRRHLLAVATDDNRWNVLQNKQQYLLSYSKDSNVDVQQLIDKLSSVGAVISSFIPRNTWLILAEETIVEALSTFPTVSLVDYSPEYKISPEWGHILALVSSDHHLARIVNGSRISDLWSELGVKAPELVGRLETHSKGPAHHLDKHRLTAEVQFPMLDPSDLRLLSEAYDPIEAAVSTWKPVLQGLVNKPACEVELKVEHNHLLVSTCARDMETVLKWLSEQPAVHWLQPRVEASTHQCVTSGTSGNIQAGVIAQTGGYSSTYVSPYIPEAHPYWKQGLAGDGQIIGCGDSGIDMDSCYFFDPNNPFQGFIPKDGYQAYVNPNHRKVVMYLAMQSDFEDAYGHGTHVSGTLAGSAWGKNATVLPDIATGGAPNAKLSFIDLSKGKVNSVWTPGDLGSGYFKYSYDLGARVHSDSWGAERFSYDSMAQSVDLFTWQNPDFVTVIAAGNDGDRNTTTSTITSPAVSKNCIAAGATLNYIPGYIPTTAGIRTFQMNVSVTLGAGSPISYPLT